MELHQFESNTETLILAIQGDMDAIGCRDIQPTIDEVLQQDQHQQDLFRVARQGCESR